MASNIVTLKDATKTNDLLPRTRMKAVCDDSGNYLDSDLAASDINALKNGGLAAGLATKADKVSTPTAGDILKTDASGNPVDTGIPAANVAQQDGYYEGLTAGNAEQLIASVFENDKTPYNFRTSGGAVNIGDREYKRSIIGGTIMWNQLVHALSSQYYTPSNCTISGDKLVATGSSAPSVYTRLGDGVIFKDHVYYLALRLKSSKNLSTVRYQIYNTNAQRYTFLGVNISLTAGEYKYIDVFVKGQADEGLNTYFYIYSVDGSTETFEEGDYLEVIPKLFDLTAMFGSSIADTIHTLDPSVKTAWFKKLFPKTKYDYSPVTPMSVNVASHDTVEFNQVNIAEDYVPTSCSLNGATLQNVITDTRSELQAWIQIYRNDNTLVDAVRINDIASNGRKIFTFNSYGGDRIIFKHNGVTQDIIFFRKYEHVLHNTVYCISFTVEGYNPTVAGGIKLSDINLNLHWDGERDGEYEPYKKNSYPLDHTLTLNGIPKLDASNNLCYDGDVYEPDGTVTRNIRDVTPDNNYTFDYGNWSTGACTVRGYAPSHKGIHLGRALSTIWGNVTVDRDNNEYNYFYFHGATSHWASLEAFKEAVIGSHILYKVSDPTTEEATPYTELQVVDDFGTEEFVDYAESQGTRDVAIPVGHNTDYQPNLRAKLEMIANNPDNDGKYLLQMDSGVASYVTFPDPDSRLDDLEDIVASTGVPTTQGTYVLTCTVDSEGAATFTWEAQS